MSDHIQTLRMMRNDGGTVDDAAWIAAIDAAIAALTEAKQQGPGKAVRHDAESWGNALNAAGWVFLEQCPEKSALLFNNCKGPLRAAILKYLELVGPTAPQVEAKRQTGEGLFYIQDTRQFVGNCPVWWGPNSNGYVTRLDEAGRYTYDKAVRQNRSRETDVPWPCEEIDALGRVTVDHQHMRPRAERLAEIAAAAKPSGEVES